MRRNCRQMPVGHCASCAAGCNESGAGEPPVRRAGARERARNYLPARIQTPQGRPPTGIVFTVVKLLVSITLTLFERPFAVYSLVPSGVSAMFQARLPTLVSPTTLPLATSIAETVPPPPLATNTRLPSRLARASAGRTPVAIDPVTACLAISTI